MLDLATLNPRCSSPTIPPKAKAGENQHDAPEFLVEEYIEKLDPSSMYCLGNNRESRTCHVKNLYYNLKEKTFFIIDGNTSEWIGVPNSTQIESEGGALVDLTSLSNHGVFAWNPERVAEGFLNGPQNIHRVAKKSILISRFVPGNTMHSLHDDLLGYYYLLRRWLYEDNGSFFDGNHHLLFLDDYGEGPYCHLFKFFTYWPIRYKVTDLEPISSKASFILFEDAVIGNTKEANWYQYGFSEPQGPIPEKNASGYKVRALASFLLQRLKLPLWNSTVIRDSISDTARKARLPVFQDVVNEYSLDFHNTQVPPPTESIIPEMVPFHDNSEEPCIAIFSRRGNRLLLNEARLALALNRALGLPVYFVRNEDTSFKKQASILRRSIIAIGMHGSLLIMSMFLPPGALLIELYPLYVPGENYTPYKTLANLPGMNIWYGAWSNTHPQLNVPHPDYPAAHGGIKTFSEDLQNKILETKGVPRHLCCTDPYWLFRIYQDTYVHIPELFTELISPGLIASNKLLREGIWGAKKPSFKDINHIPPALINIEEVVYHWSSEPLSLHLRWEKPWNVERVLKYGVWIHQTYTEYHINEAMLDLSDLPMNICNKDEVHVWIRSYYNSLQSPDAHTEWSKKIICKCPNKLN